MNKLSLAGFEPTTKPSWAVRSTRLNYKLFKKFKNKNIKSMNISFFQFITLIILGILFFGDIKQINKNIKKLIKILKKFLNNKWSKNQEKKDLNP